MLTRTPGYTSTIVAIIAVSMALITACGSDGGVSKRHAVPPPRALHMTPSQTATALKHANTAELGVWAMLHQLGVAVYSTTGKQVMAGALPGASGVHIYDTEIAALAAGATEDPQPVAKFAERLRAAGVKTSPAKIVAAFSAGFDAQPKLASVQLLHAMKVDVTAPDARITPLQEWLLVLDGFVPAQSAAADTKPSGDSNQPGWGAAGGTGQLPPLADPMALLHLQMMALGIDLSITPASATAAMGDGAPGESIDLTTTLRVRPVGSTTVWGDGSIIVPTTTGPIHGIPVEIATSGSEFTSHGTFTAGGSPFAGQPIGTDSAGTAKLTYQAGTDPGTSKDPAHTASGTVTASVATLPIMHKAYALPAWAVGYFAGFPPRIAIATPMVTWHEQKPKPASRFGDGEWKGSAPISGNLSIKGLSIDFTGTAEFTFTLEQGEITDGTLTASWDGSGAVNGRSVTGTGRATMGLSGTAEHVVGDGSSTIGVTLMGVSNSQGFPAHVTFSPTSGTCTSISGDLLIDARKRAASAGITSDITGPFTATRVSGSGDC